MENITIIKQKNEDSGNFEYNLCKQGNVLLDRWYDRIYDYLLEKIRVFKVCDGQYQNVVDETGKLLLNEWYDTVYPWSIGIEVSMNEKYNMANFDGTLMFSDWYDEIKKITGNPENNWIKVRDGNKWFTAKDGKIQTKEPFDNVYNLPVYPKVTRGGKSNFIRPDGTLFFDEFVEDCTMMSNEFVSIEGGLVKDVFYKDGSVKAKNLYVESIAAGPYGGFWGFLSNKYTVMTNNLERVNDEWYDDLSLFYTSCVYVQKGNKSSLLKLKKGEKPTCWYDKINPVGHISIFAAKEENKWYFIGTDGKKLSDKGYKNIHQFNCDMFICDTVDGKKEKVFESDLI